MWRWQKVGLLALSLAFALGLLAEPRATLIGLFAALALPFLFVVLLRGVALWAHFSAPAPDTGAGALEKGEDELPRYSVLVPLFREADVVGDLVAALSRIDYPPDRLEVLLVTESVDEETRAAIAGTPLPAHMQVVVVPDGTPRTKPRALNHALELASGEFVVVYDAEDCPEPSQLRRALAVFAGSVAPVGCVQARLNIYNPRQNWLTRQFTIEYTALFDCLLPALERLGLPVPLGGTSNHFPRPVLEEVGGWDAYNVTEDADLGIRLARAGFEIRVLESTTWEEAPARLGGWLRQRTRWLKGWMQTYLVHMRQPRRLLRELGLFRFAGLQVLMGGMILSALVHPWFYALAAADAARGLAIDVPLTLPSHALWWLGFVNLVAGYVTGMALGVVALAGRGWLRLAAHAALMPLYWLLVSAAAYRALWQLVRAPYVWEKTAHTARGARSSSMPAE
jgi:cellulose synthase/poly-beta-1,6-N-acetylglucosamine synthase-like glycosyltransferase